MISGETELKKTIYVGLAIHSVVFYAIWLLREEEQRHDHRGQDDDDEVDGEDDDDDEGDEREEEERMPRGARMCSNLVRR